MIVQDNQNVFRLIYQKLNSGMFWSHLSPLLRAVPEVLFRHKAKHGNNRDKQANSGSDHAPSAFVAGKEKEGANRNGNPYPSDYLINGVKQEVGDFPPHFVILLCVAVSALSWVHSAPRCYLSSIGIIVTQKHLTRNRNCITLSPSKEIPQWQTSYQKTSR